MTHPDQGPKYTVLRRILSILLVFLFIFNAGGYYFVYVQLLNSFKLTAGGEIREHVSLDKLELIKISNRVVPDRNQFERVNESEIKYNGRMYDIYSEQSGDGFTYFYCLNDAYEDIIMNAFAEYIVDKAGDESNTAVISLLKIIITHATVPPQFTYLNYNHSYIISLNSGSDISVLIQDIPSPPPKQA